VDSLDHFDRIRPALRDLGRKHAVEYGVRPEHYETVRTAMLWALGQALQPHFHAATKQAWHDVLQKITREMLAGAA
jgi:hemoglobin-like flavoprotein